jgi:hypothetical protein
MHLVSGVDRHPFLDEAGSACFNALRQAVEEAKFFEGDPDGGDVSLACWSLVHGLSALIVDGRLVEYDLIRPRRSPHG